MWNTVNVNVDVDIDVDDIIDGISDVDKIRLITSLSGDKIKSILVEKGLFPKGLPIKSISNLEGNDLKRILCDIISDSYHVDNEKLLNNLKQKL